MRYRLIPPKWLAQKGAKVLEGYYEEVFIDAKNKEGYGIYYFPNCANINLNRPLAGKDIENFKWIFVDMDLKDKVYSCKEEFLLKIMEFPLLPSLTVDSGHGIHCYWAIENLTRETYCYLQMALINEFTTDHSLWTVLQLMRFPGSYNTKEENNFLPVHTISEISTGGTYKVEQFVEILPEISEVQMRKIQRHIDKIEGRLSESYLEVSSDIPEKFLELIDKNQEVRQLFENPTEIMPDRSSADMSLANRLFTLEFSKQDALSILMNTQKARSRNDPQEYAEMTVNKVYTDRNPYYEEPLSYYQNTDFSKNLGTPVGGCIFWDRLTKPWRTKEVLTIVSAPGCGKSSITLKNFKSMIDNNPSKDHIFVFFSLEMTLYEILDRWNALTGNDIKYKERLYVVANEDASGKMRYLNMQDIYLYCKGIEKSTGKKILSIAVDHIDAINTSIDLKINPNFEADGKECEHRRGDKVSLKKGELFVILRDMSKELDLFIIVQSQTTKEKSGFGDLPLHRNAIFGTSKGENYTNYLLTLWKPLLRVQDQTDIRVVGWKYAKIREQKGTDDIEENIQYLLKYDQTMGDYLPIKSSLEKDEVQCLLNQCDELRKKESKKEFTNYRFSPKDIKSLLKKKYEENKS